MEAFMAWLNEWNGLLAHPFRWTYDGEGLHEKAVKRFTAMLDHAAAQLGIRILTKELLLMTNLPSGYLAKVDADIWNEFVRTPQSKQDLLISRIQREESPVSKKNAQNALERHSQTLQKSLGENNLVPAP
jgi:hypothetical protein